MAWVYGVLWVIAGYAWIKGLLGVLFYARWNSTLITLWPEQWAVPTTTFGLVVYYIVILPSWIDVAIWAPTIAAMLWSGIRLYRAVLWLGDRWDAMAERIRRNRE